MASTRAELGRHGGLGWSHQAVGLEALSAELCWRRRLGARELAARSARMEGVGDGRVVARAAPAVSVKPALV